LHLFPGVEITVNAGIHLLALFGKDTTTSDIDTLLGKVDYGGTKGDSDNATRKSPIEVIKAVIGAGGIPIPAHAEGPKGLLRVAESDGVQPVLDAHTLQQVLLCRDILAIEVGDPSRPKPALYENAEVSWTEVLGSDCHNFRTANKPGARFTWVKMATPSLEGLRLALLDGEGFSIRRSDDPQPFDPFALPEHFIEAVESPMHATWGEANCDGDMSWTSWTSIAKRVRPSSASTGYPRAGTMREGSRTRRR